jgi:hypothetical protein
MIENSLNNLDLGLELKKAKEIGSDLRKELEKRD